MNAISGYIDSTYGIDAFELGLDIFQQDSRNPDRRGAAQSYSFAGALEDTLTLSPEAQMKALEMSPRDGVVHAYDESPKFAQYAQYAEDGYGNSVKALTDGENAYTPSNEQMRSFPLVNQADMANVAAIYAQNILPMQFTQNNSFTPTTSRLQITSGNFYSASSAINTIKPEQVASAYRAQASMAARDSMLVPTGSWSLGLHLEV